MKPGNASPAASAATPGLQRGSSLPLRGGGHTLAVAAAALDVRGSGFGDSIVDGFLDFVRLDREPPSASSIDPGAHGP